MALILEFRKGQFWGHCYFCYRPYIIDLSAVSDIAFPIMFADDTHIFIQGKYPNEMELKLTNEIAKLTNWLKANKLSLNINKTHTVNCSIKSHNIRTRQNNINIDGKAIETVNYTNIVRSRNR